jgi:hypothetical protein
MKAIQCGEAILVNVHGTLTQMGPNSNPKGGDPETCDTLKFTMSNISSVHKVSSCAKKPHVYHMVVIYNVVALCSTRSRA